MGLFVKTLLPLSLCFLICTQLSATASLPSNFAGRHKRSGDVNTLDAASNQMITLSALKARISAMQADLTTLKAKHCQTGQLHFSPTYKTHIVYENKRGKRDTQHVNFSLPFNTVPWVAISLLMLDSTWDRDLRVITATSAVSTSGFDACAIQWSDTHIYNVMATWVACNV